MGNGFMRGLSLDVGAVRHLALDLDNDVFALVGDDDEIRYVSRRQSTACDKGWKKPSSVILHPFLHARMGVEK